MTRTASETHLDHARLSWVTLRLSPAAVEKEFWDSVSGRLRLLDMFGLSSSTLITVMIIRKIGWFSRPDWLFHFLPTATYLVAGLVQLTLFLRKPDLYQRHRFRINLVNRLTRAVTVTWAAQSMAPTRVMMQFMGVLNRSPAVATDTHLATVDALRILRTAAGIPLLWVSHAVNYLVPFWVMLPLQLYTLAVASQILPAIMCTLQQQPAAVVNAVHMLAGRVRLLVRALKVVVPVFPSQEQQQPDPVKDVLLLVTVAFALILLVIPCLTAYCVEGMTKSDFLHNRHLRQLRQQGSSGRQPPPQRMSRRDRLHLLGWAAFDVLCLMCLVCEAAVDARPVPSCS